MNIKVMMQKNNDKGDIVIGRGTPDKAFAHALKLLEIQGNNPRKILEAMQQTMKKR